MERIRRQEESSQKKHRALQSPRASPLSTHRGHRAHSKLEHFLAVHVQVLEGTLQAEGCGWCARASCQWAGGLESRS